MRGRQAGKQASRQAGTVNTSITQRKLKTRSNRKQKKKRHPANAKGRKENSG
jgi:hypothetical protein